MANRFIDTGFFKSPYVRSLKAPLKTLYSFIICDCNGSGIWAADFEIASVYIGQEVTKKEFEESFIKAGKAVDLRDGKYFIPDFLEHQYPKGLSETNPAHVNFISELQKYKLLDENLKPLESPLKGSYVMVKEKEKEKVMVKKGEEKKLIIPFDTEDFKEAWKNLLLTKKWKNKSEVSLAASLKKLSNHSEQDAIQMIINATVGEWQGLFELKEKSKETKSGKIENFLQQHELAKDL